MARDKSTLSQRKGKTGSAEDDKAASNKHPLLRGTTGNKNKKKTDDELDDEFEAACEKWCGVGLKIIFMCYSLFGVAVSSYEYMVRPDMANVLDPAMNLAGTTVVLTGGCAGIGLETARMLATRGAHVAVGRVQDMVHMTKSSYLDWS
jgi:hypothetical protein